MESRRTFLWGVVVSVGGASQLIGGERGIVHFGKTKPCLETGIPSHGYEYRPRSTSQSVISTTGMMLQKSVTEVDAGLFLANDSKGPQDEERLNRCEETWRDEQGRSFIRRKCEESTVESREGESSASRTERQHVEALPPPHFPSDAAAEVVTRSTQSRITTQATKENPFPRRKRIKLYQLDRDALVVNHCAVSQVALQLHSDGLWVVSLRGDQNRVPEPPNPVVYNPTLHIKRNEFFVRMRCLGASLNQPAEFAPMAGKPVMAVLDPQPFWVENGQPKYVRFPAHQPDVVTYFDLIDRVAVEFFYR